MIIGITGTLSSGKGTIVNFLKTKGFKHYSVRKYLINEIEKRGLPLNRDSMVLVANNLRETNGQDFIIEELYKLAKEFGGDVIIESVRAIGEVESLKSKGDFYLFAVDASPFLRYERAKKRNSETDKRSYREFLMDEQKELRNTDPTKGNIEKCMSMANYKFTNEGSVTDLENAVKRILSQIKTDIREKEESKGDFNDSNIEVIKIPDKTEDKTTNEFKEKTFVKTPSEQLFLPSTENKKPTRPSWDNYFMEIARTVSKRGTCNRGQTGALITKDKQILATGYVGSPVGIEHCDDVGHELKKTIHEDGSITEHCVRTIHAEQNAICQAAKKGVAIEGSTLYTMMVPCLVCAKMIINSGIKRVVAEKKYHAGQDTEELFKKAGINFQILIDEVVKY